MRALVVPADGSPIREIDVPATEGLAVLQAAVGGEIDHVPLPPLFGDSAAFGTAWIHAEGKLVGKPFNGRATDFFVPGHGLFWGDYIAGDMVLTGCDPRTGENAELPAVIERRIRLIEREAGSPAPTS